MVRSSPRKGAGERLEENMVEAKQGNYLLGYSLSGLPCLRSQLAVCDWLS